jgi:hypothetical protein
MRHRLRLFRATGMTRQGCSTLCIEAH